MFGWWAHWRFGLIPCLWELNWSLMNWREDESLVHIWKGPVKVLSFIYRTVIIVLTIHYLKIRLEALLNLLNYVAFWSIRINWLSSFPIIPKNFCKLINRKIVGSNLLVPLLEKTMISDSVAGYLVNVLQLICILMSTASLIEKFLVVSVVRSIVFWICHVSTVIPRCNCAWPRKFNTFIK